MFSITKIATILEITIFDEWFQQYLEVNDT